MTNLSKKGALWLASFGVWLVVGFFYGNQTYFDMLAMHHSYVRLLVWGLSFGLTWGLVTPPILLLATRFRFEEGAFIKAISAYLAAFVAVNLFRSFSNAIATVIIRPFDPIPVSASIVEQLRLQLRYSSAGAFLIFGLLACVGQVIEYGRIARKRELEAAELSAMLAQAEVASLRSQLQPHFLFNTLNGIVALVRSGDNKNAEAMIMGLSQLLRYALDEMGRPEVTLKEEIDFLNLYLGLEQMRFPDRLKSVIEIQEEAGCVMIPSLLLQPLVENAVRHAVATRLAPTEIRVEGKVEDGHLVVIVSDDGPGLPKGFCEGDAKGIGLSNARKRLQALYGDDQTMTICSGPEGGVVARISILLKGEGAKN